MRTIIWREAMYLWYYLSIQFYQIVPYQYGERFLGFRVFERTCTPYDEWSVKKTGVIFLYYILFSIFMAALLGMAVDWIH